MAPEPRAPRAAPAGPVPGLDVERSLQGSDARLVGGMDEVGRGALAGPVSAGLVVLRPGTARGIPGLRDSKLLSPARREALVPCILAWCAAHGVGHSTAQEIDAFGLTAALGLAGRRALAAAAHQGAVPDVVLLDGRHDWLSTPEELSVCAAPAPASAHGAAPGWSGSVVTRVRADLSCASVAAASVLAKVERDRVMRGLAVAWPQYGWETNKGYGAAGHLRALEEDGPTPHHRLSWRLPRRPVVARAGTSRDETT